MPCENSCSQICIKILLVVYLFTLQASTEGFPDVKCNTCEPIVHSPIESSRDSPKTPSVEECKPYIQEAVKQCQIAETEDQSQALADDSGTEEESGDIEEKEDENEIASDEIKETIISPSGVVEETLEESIQEEEEEETSETVISEEVTEEESATAESTEEQEREKLVEEVSEATEEEQDSIQEESLPEESVERISLSTETDEEKESQEDLTEESVEEASVTVERHETEELSIESKEEEEVESEKESTESPEIEEKIDESIEEESGPSISKYNESREESLEELQSEKYEEPKSESVSEEEEPSLDEIIVPTEQTSEATTQESEEKEDEEEEEEMQDEEEEEEEEEERIILGTTKPYKSRTHIEEILGIDEIGIPDDLENEKITMQTLRELKKIYDTAIKPLESLYKYRDLSSRQLGDAEIFSKPMVLFLGPWSAGKSSIINYLLGIERTARALKTGVEPTDTQFTVISYGDDYQKISGTEMASDWAFSSVQKFGQNFLNHFRGYKIPNKLLQKIVLVDTPGIIENRKMYERGYPVNDAFQWFIDRADAIYVVFDPAKLEIGTELESLLDQLKGRETQVRFVLNKADTIRKSDLMKVIGQLFWNLSPLLGSSEAPVIYAVSLMTKPFHPGAPTKFLLDQELMFLADLRDTMDKRVENRILFARRHAVRVRNHAKLVDCYLNTYYQHKSIFASKKRIAEQITEHPAEYAIYEGLSTLTNVSRYDLPDPGIYRDFFRLNPLYDFRPLSSTCSYFRGCPLDKLDHAISYDIMQILGQYKKKTQALMQNKEATR